MVLSPKIPLARYIFTRLRRLGIHALPGVPGDFTLKALDHLSPSGLKWIGTCNELNAGYLADGYARTRGLGALVTTYGVGELSAINAIAGSYAEFVPVVSIVGTPSRRLQMERKNVHHTLGDGRPGIFAEMARYVTVAQGNLVDEATAVEEVDRVIGACVRESRPVYLELPADMVEKEVDSDRLKEKINVGEDSGIVKEEKTLANDILKRIHNANQPLLLVDSGGGVRQLRNEINAFIQTSGIPTLCMPSGNNMVEHSHPNFYGVHSGPVGQIDTMPYVDGSDLVLAIGPMFSDTQTLSWKVVPPPDKIITLNKTSLYFPTAFNNSQKHKVNLRSLLTTLTSRLSKQPLPPRQNPAVSSLGNFRTILPPSTSPTPDGPLTQSHFYTHLTPHLQPHDTIILGNATPILGGRDIVLPPGAQIISSGQWFSIGHMFPLSIGVSLAHRPRSSHPEKKARGNVGRTILLDGDGGFQVSAQELGTLIRYRIPLVIFVINNSGYAYERMIHGKHEEYNNVAPWQYVYLAGAMGATKAQLAQGDKEGYTVSNHVVKTWRQLDMVLTGKDFVEGRGLMVVDVRMGKFDVPEKFRRVFKRAGEALGED